MLIDIKQNKLQGVSRYKNEYWESQNKTPNEAYEHSLSYRSLVRNFSRYNNLNTSANHKFIEVRLVRQQPKLVYTIRKEWYENAKFGDAVFWVFSKPISEQIDNRTYLYYVLEPMECCRVLNTIGRPAGKNLRDAFVIPTECCQHAWDETSAGYSDHIHYRPKHEPTSLEIEKKAKLDNAANKLLERAVDIRTSHQWQDIARQTEEKLLDASTRQNKVD